jgi:predicted transposase YdaD
VVRTLGADAQKVGRKEGRKEGRKAGRQEGRKEGRKDTHVTVNNVHIFVSYTSHSYHIRLTLKSS